MASSEATCSRRFLSLNKASVPPINNISKRPSPTGAFPPLIGVLSIVNFPTESTTAGETVLAGLLKQACQKLDW